MNKTNKRNETATATTTATSKIYTNVDNLGNIVITQVKDNEYIHTHIGKSSSTEEDFIKRTIRHYGAATPQNIMKEAEKTVQLQTEEQIAEKQYKTACNLAGIETEEDRNRDRRRNELIKTAAGYVAMAAVFFAGVLSAKKYFKK